LPVAIWLRAHSCKEGKMLKRAEEVIASGDERAAIDFAISMNRRVVQGKRELDRIKTYLRKVAMRGTMKVGQPSPQEGVTLEGNIGSVFVQFPPDEARPRRGSDLRDVEVNVSRQTFYLLFTKTTVVRPARDFVDQISTVDPSERAVVDRFVEVTSPTGKVNLPQ